LAVDEASSNQPFHPLLVLSFDAFCFWLLCGGGVYYYVCVCYDTTFCGCGSKGMSLYTSFTVMIICYYSGVAIRRRVSA